MKVKCGREFYSRQEQLIKWCKENIGPGGWEESPALLFADRHQWVWTIYCLFGYSTFDFVNDEDGKRFKEHWGC